MAFIYSAAADRDEDYEEQQLQFQLDDLRTVQKDTLQHDTLALKQYQNVSFTSLSIVLFSCVVFINERSTVQVEVV